MFMCSEDYNTLKNIIENLAPDIVGKKLMDWYWKNTPGIHAVGAGGSAVFTSGMGGGGGIGGNVNLQGGNAGGLGGYEGGGVGIVLPAAHCIPVGTVITITNHSQQPINIFP